MTLHTFAEVLLWSCLALVVYAYAGYALLIGGLSRLFGRKPEPPALDDPPMISLLLAAHNEEAVIAERLENALAMDYPADRVEILVGSDGSQDRTAEIVRQFADRGVRLMDFAQNRGKASVLNSLIDEATGGIVLLSDANTMIDPAAARNLVRWFGDPTVGSVCGRLVLTDPRTGKNVDSLYWKYETYLKRCEGRLGALLGANGAIYATRRALYEPIPAGTIVDDFVIPLLIKQRVGARIVYDCEAVAREETPENIGSEYHRRVRIGAGGFQAIGMLWRLLDPRRGWVAFTFFSHKVLRWLCPFFMIGALASNVALAAAGGGFYRWLLAAQVGFYGLSMLAGLVPSRSPLLKPLRLATLFTSMNVALFAGFIRWLRGGQKGTWKRTARVGEVAENPR